MTASNGSIRFSGIITGEQRIPTKVIPIEDRLNVFNTNVLRAQSLLSHILPSFAEYLSELTELFSKQGCKLTHIKYVNSFPIDGKCHNFGAIDYKPDNYRVDLLLGDNGRLYMADINDTSKSHVSLTIVEFNQVDLQQLFEEKSDLFVHFVRQIASRFGETEIRLQEHIKEIQKRKKQARDGDSLIEINA